MIPIGRGAGKVEGPVTEAGRRLLDRWWPVHSVRREAITREVLAIEAAARAEAGHRIPEPHDCFLMNCARLGDEVRRLQVQVTEAAQAARAEVIAEIRRGVEGLATDAAWWDDEPTADGFKNAVLALLPPTEPK